MGMRAAQVFRPYGNPPALRATPFLKGAAKSPSQGETLRNGAPGSSRPTQCTANVEAGLCASPVWESGGGKMPVGAHLCVRPDDRMPA